jgi:hypothetical protein
MLRHTDAGWSNPKVLTIFALIFVCGLVIGAAITVAVLHRTMLPKRTDHAPAAKISVERLRRDLRLTPEQERFVTKELDDYAKYYQNIEEERQDVAEHGKQRILGILDPEQKKRFLQMFRSQPLPTGTEGLR